MKPGLSEEVALTIPEGFTRWQIAALARKAGLRGNYMKASTAAAAHFSPQAWGAHRGVTSLEGFLFPATYYLDRHGWVSSLVQKQLAAFRLNFATINMRYAHSRDLTRYDVITIASIIEREAQVQTTDRRCPRSSTTACARGSSSGSTARCSTTSTTRPVPRRPGSSTGARR